MNKFSKKTYGFTLVELMVTIAIAAILMVVAVPSYTDFIKRNTVESLQSRLAAAVITARTEAASRNVTSILCASSNGTSCGGAWTSGWIVSVNGEVVLVYRQHNADYPIKFEDDTGNDLASISFTNQGFTVGSVRAFATLCEPSKAAKYARGFNIERSGRVMKSLDSDNNGIYERVFDDGTVNPIPTALSCS